MTPAATHPAVSRRRHRQLRLTGGCRPRLGVLLLPLMLAALPTAALSQPSSPPEEAPPPPVLRAPDPSQGLPGARGPGGLAGIEAAEISILKLWFERGERLRAGSPEGAADTVERMLALMDREGIRGMEVLASAFAHEGKHQLEAGNYLRAQESFQLALRFDPTLPLAHLGLADARRLGGEGLLPFLQELVAAVRAAAANFWFAYMALANQLLLLMATLVCFAAVFVVTMGLRYQAAWRHDLLEFFQGRGFSEPAARLLANAVAILPLLLWLSGGWILLYWAAGTFRYQGKGERAVALAVMVLIAGLVPAAAFTLSVLRVTDSATMRATVSALRGGYEPEKALYIQKVLRERPDDPTFHFLLGSILKDGGYFLEAYDHYQRVIGEDPGSYRAYNNVGNLYFATGQYGQAVSWYRRATDVNPRFAIGYFNMYRAQREQLHFTEADESLARARELDAEAVADYLSRSSGAVDTTPGAVDAKIPMSEVWLEVVRGGAAHVNTAVPAGSATPDLLNPLTVGGAVALLIMLPTPLLRRRRRAQICPSCGRGYCDRCQKEGGDIDLCPQCTHFYLYRGDLAPDVQEQKAAEVRRHERGRQWFRRIASVVWPGSAQLLGGRVVWGTILALAWTYLGLGLLARGKLLAFAATPYVTSGTTPMWIAVLVMAAIWTGGLLLAPARSAGEQD